MDNTGIKKNLKSMFCSLPRPVIYFLCNIIAILQEPFCWYYFYKAKNLRNSLRQIVVIGDSHATFFSGDSGEIGSNTKKIYVNRKIGVIQYEPGCDTRFCVLRLGPGLAYNLARYGTSVKVREKFEWLDKHFLNGDETIIFAFGEIDIRTHVFRYTSNSKSYATVIDEILSNYVQFLIQVKERGYQVYAWGPIASQKDNWKVNESYPRFGNEVQRNKATEYFNKSLKRMCDNNEIGFMSVFDDTVDNHYRTKEEYIFDQCHLGQNARTLLEEQLRVVGLTYM